MPVNEALLRAVLNDPEDDGVRLVYADWLEENADPARAEFIRVQIELARLSPGDPRRDSLADREEELLREHRERWEAELPEPPRYRLTEEEKERLCRYLNCTEGNLPKPPPIWGRWRRGFIDEVVLNGGTGTREFAEAILATIPLRRVQLVDVWAYDSCAGSPLLAHIRELAIRIYDHNEGHLYDSDFAEVLRWPELAQLTHLELQGDELTPEGMHALAAASFPQLRSLVLGKPRSGEVNAAPTWDALLSAGWLGQLEELTVQDRPLSREQVARLAAKLHPGRLRLLDLESAGLGDTEAEILVHSGVLASVRELWLAENAIGPAGARRLMDALPAGTDLCLNGNPIWANDPRALAASPLLRHLPLITFSGPVVDDAAAIALANSPHLRRPWGITLTGGSIGSVGAHALLTSPRMASLGFVDLENNRVASLPACQFPRLRILDLTGNRLEGAGLTAFCGDSRLPDLFSLNLNRNRLGPEVARALANAPGFPALGHLHLDGNPLGDEGVKALAAGEGLPRLEVLYLRDCGIGDEGVKVWMDSPRLAQLKCFWLSSKGNPISEAVLAAFQKRAAEFGCEVY